MTDAMDSTALVLVLTTVGAGYDVRALAHTLVEERLAACVGVQPPMLSVYRWQEAIESVDERQVVIKTTRARLDALRQRLVELHPYEVPELLVVAADSLLPAYAQWLRDAVR